jgi:hypothetical protein
MITDQDLTALPCLKNHRSAQTYTVTAPSSEQAHVIAENDVPSITRLDANFSAGAEIPADEAALEP